MGVDGVSLELSAMAVWRREDDRQVLGIVGAGQGASLGDRAVGIGLSRGSSALGGFYFLERGKKRGRVIQCLMNGGTCLEPLPVGGNVGAIIVRCHFPGIEQRRRGGAITQSKFLTIRPGLIGQEILHEVVHRRDVEQTFFDALLIAFRFRLPVLEDQGRDGSGEIEIVHAIAEAHLAGDLPIIGDQLWPGVEMRVQKLDDIARLRHTLAIVEDQVRNLPNRIDLPIGFAVTSVQKINELPLELDGLLVTGDQHLL